MRESRVELNQKSYRGVRVASLLFSLAAAAAGLALVFGLLLFGVRIGDDGMSPVLRAGDTVLFERVSKHVSMPRRGAAYAFRTETGVAIGRIVGLPGETVELQSGTVFIDGAMLDESAYASPAPPEVAAAQTVAPLTLPAGCFLLLPDARELMLLDPAAMTIPFSALIGRAMLRVAPLSAVSVFVE